MKDWLQKISFQVVVMRDDVLAMMKEARIIYMMSIQWRKRN